MRSDTICSTPPRKRSPHRSRRNKSRRRPCTRCPCIQSTSRPSDPFILCRSGPRHVRQYAFRRQSFVTLTVHILPHYRIARGDRLSLLLRSNPVQELDLSSITGGLRCSSRDDRWKRTTGNLNCLLRTSWNTGRLEIPDVFPKYGRTRTVVCKEGHIVNSGKCNR